MFFFVSLRTVPGLLAGTVLITALDLESGDERWRATFQHGTNAPIIADHDAMVLVRPYGDELHAYDAADGKPFSTEFSFTRFLTPSLQPEGWALFMDSDFLFRADIAELAADFDDSYSLMCVKHDYAPKDKTKMAGQLQQNYARKNWSSLMAFNCSKSHVTPWEVNSQPGSWLHQMKWLSDNEIGTLPKAWNWLDGHSKGEAKAVHFTRGTPDMAGWENTQYADEWRTIDGC